MPRKKSERENVMSSLIKQHSHNITYAYVYTHARMHVRNHIDIHVCTYDILTWPTWWSSSTFFSSFHFFRFCFFFHFERCILFCFVLSFVFLLLLLYVFKFQFIRAKWCSFHMVHYTEWPHSVKHINMRSSSYFLPFCCFNFIVLLCAWVLLSCFQATFFVFIIFFCVRSFKLFEWFFGIQEWIFLHGHRHIAAKGN